MGNATHRFPQIKPVVLHGEPLEAVEAINAAECSQSREDQLHHLSEAIETLTAYHSTLEGQMQEYDA